MRGVIHRKPYTYTAEVRRLSRHDLRLVAMDLGVPGAIRWHHPFSGRYNRTRAQMIAAIEAVRPLDPAPESAQLEIA